MMKGKNKKIFEIVAGFIGLIILTFSFFVGLSSLFQGLTPESQARIVGGVIGKLFIFALIILVVKKLIKEFKG